MVLKKEKLFYFFVKLLFDSQLNFNTIVLYSTSTLLCFMLVLYFELDPKVFLSF